MNCRKVLAGLAFIGADYELVHVDYFKDEQRTPDFTALNPNQTMPVLVDEEFVLWESNAILQYVADKLGNHHAYPAGLRERADLGRWMLWEAAHWFPSCYVFLRENCVKPLLGQTPDRVALETEGARFHKLAGVLDQHLAKHTWLMGKHPTIGDIALAAPMHLHRWQQLPLARYPRLMRWMTEGVEALPCWQATQVYPGFTLQAHDAAA